MFLGAVYRLLSGVWIPVTLFPELLYRINLWLPFRAVYAIPVSILTTEMKRKVIWQSVSVQMVWLVILYGFSLFLWRVGRKKLVVQGG